MKRFLGLMIAVTLTLVGCGGDSSGGTNSHPTASFTASPQSGEAPLTVSFDASRSSDSDGSITSYAWDFGDGNTGTGQTLNHTYSASGNYTARLTVTDNDGATNSTTNTIDVSDPTGGNTAPSAAFTAMPDNGQAPLTVDFDASGSSDPDGSIASYAWDFGDGGTGTGQTLTHTFSAAGSYTAKLTVTDNDGASSSATRTIEVSDVTVQAIPEYLSFSGTRAATINVTSNGDWTAESDQSWLQLSQTSGSGDATVTVTIDRSAISPDHYAGSILLKGGTSREVVTVYMRFPNVSGNITSSTGQIQTGSLSLESNEEPQLPRGTYVPGEVLVMLEPYAVAIAQGLPGQALSTAGRDIGVEAFETTAMDLASSYGFETSSALSSALPVFTFDTSGMPVAEALQVLQADGRVKLAQPNRIVEAHATPNDPMYSDQWHYGTIDLSQGWDLTLGSTDVIVAVVDTGVDPTHSDLSANLLSGYDFVNNTVSMSDPDGHGTHVSGTVAAVTDNATGVAGVGWNSKITPIRVLGSSGGSQLDIFRGIAFAAGLCVNNSNGTQVCPNYQADVINLSLGLGNPNCTSLPQDSIMEDAIAYATGNGSTVIASAGNDGCNIVGVPAAYAGAIAVSATDPNNNLAPYSNYGSEIWIAAPGGDMNNFGTTGGVLSTLPGDSYGYLQGTSMAAPHISGVAALLLAANPDLTPVEVQFLLSQTAKDLGAAGWDQQFGWGLVDADAAVQAARDLLTAYYSDFVVRLTDGSSTVVEVRADSGGNFALTNVASGSYTLEAGNDHNNNGILGDPGEFYGSTNITVNYSGDLTNPSLNVGPQ